MKETLWPKTILITKEAELLNIPVFKTGSKNLLQLGIGCNQKRLLASDTNSASVFVLAKNKLFTKKLLSDLSFPVAKGDTIENEQDLSQKFNDFKKPVVMKPIDSSWGRGVTTNINSLEKAKDAFAKISETYKTMMEEQVDGRDFRVMVVNNKVVAVLERVQPKVTGDGKNTIRKLIENENKDRSSKLGSKLKKITIDKGLEEKLKEQNLTLESILEKGKEITVRFNANISSGGTGIDRTDEICEENKQTLIKAAQIAGMPTVGIDVLSKNISVPMGKNGAKIIELNSWPDIEIHHFPSQGKSRNVAKEIVNYLFPDPKKAWIKINENKIQSLYEKLKSTPKKATLKKDFFSTEEQIIKPVHNLNFYLLNPLVTSIEI